MTTIENINDKDYTVVWHEAQPTRYLRSSMAGGGYLFFAACGKLKLDCHIATALPALPRYPKNDEATIRLLSLYRAHGLVVIVTCDEGYEWAYESIYPDTAPITHATFNGERVEIAIEGGLL